MPESVDVAVASYASDYSISHTEARARLARIGPLQELMESIRELETERLAGWGINHQGRFTAWVLLTGSALASPDAERIAANHTDLEIRMGAAHTYTELLSGQRQLMSLGATGRTDDTVSQPTPLEGLADMIAYTGIDMVKNAVQIGLDPGSSGDGLGGTPAGTVDAADDTFADVSARASQLLGQALTVNYTIEDAADFSTAAEIMGGQHLTPEQANNTGTGFGDCTSGFTAQHRSTQAYGIITAAHCTDATTDRIIQISPSPGIVFIPESRHHGPSLGCLRSLCQ